MITSERIQSYFREVARRQYEVVELAPFTLFFHPKDPLPFFNYAIPDAPEAGITPARLAALRAAFHTRGRIPRFELVEAFAPQLGGALESAGFEAEPPTCLMILDPANGKPAPDVQGLRIDILTKDSHFEEARRLLHLQRTAFGMNDADQVSEADARFFVDTLGAGRGIVAWLGDEPVGGGALLPPTDGIAEVAGIAVIEKHRRHGIGAALTAAAVHEARAAGVSCAVLSAADQRAGRVYEGVGFRTFGATRFYRDP